MTRLEELNKRAEFQKPSRQSDGRGGWKIGYAPFVTLWAGLKPQTKMQDRERVETQQKQTHMTYLLTIRYRNDITADMRAVIDGRKYYIMKNPYDPDGMRRWLTMECEERNE
ncbi:phage head closure protein [Paenibacillus alkalitolerans]|uniref:phage head closure protein n=1 Tax=Paenibacillus alkalitolerans TaxID=2799335 RepID=UPI0018F73EE2|nr:phage head closure protein [Paenibacillus alkalitolerans]